MTNKQEKLAYWFFRLNGFFTIQNLVIHPESQKLQKGHRQETDVDIAGVRFPFRKELKDDPAGPMEDYKDFNIKKTLFILTEVKRTRGNFNEAWNEDNIRRALNFAGILEDPENCIKSLISKGIYEDENIRIQLCLISSEKNPQTKFQDALKISWKDVSDFIFDRFKKYKRQKSSHPQWEETGQLLWELFKKLPQKPKHHDETKLKEEFFKLISESFDLPQHDAEQNLRSNHAQN